MSSPLRRAALAVMLSSMALLVLTVAVRPSATSPGSTADPTPGLPRPTATATPNPFAVTSADDVVTIERLWAPAPFVARAEGTASASGIIVSVETDGRALAPITLIANDDGRFVIDIVGLDPGPQTLCVAGACQRVLVAGETEERALVEARIEQAIQAARERFDLDRLIPGWTFDIGGPNTSVGGSANPDAKVITINANSGRSLAEYEITVLHEIAHGIDETWLDDHGRARYREMRAIDESVPWGTDRLLVGDDRWRDAGEDFAEVFVVWVLGPDYAIMTTDIATQPTAEDLRMFCVLVAAEPLDCDEGADA